MVIVQKGNESVLAVCGKQKPSGDKILRPSHHTLSLELPEGELLHHTLTGEMYFLEKNEKEDENVKQELVSRWFYVPEGFDECKYAQQMRKIAELLQKKKPELTDFTILTTTDCNARCYYCYENGINKYPMSDKVAHDTADFIIKNCGGKRATLNWFGGEPLYNSRVIDLIINDLIAGGIRYSSTMVSNGYLFDEETVKKAAELWKLKHVQITLDGKEKIYNRTKAYIYKNVNAYQRVLNNIDTLLNNEIAVTIRMNLGARNAQDLLELAEELAEKFGGRKGFSVYTHLLYEDFGAGGEFSTINEALAALKKLSERLSQRGLYSKQCLNDDYRIIPCMAANDNRVMITPDGSLGKCECHIETDLVGTIYEGITNSRIIEKWKEWKTCTEECTDCAAFPICSRKLKYCFDTFEGCSEESRINELDSITQRMLNTYEKWKEKEDKGEQKNNEA